MPSTDVSSVHFVRHDRELAAVAQRPRLLVLAPRYPYPLVSGDRVRIVHVCRQLAAGFDITLLCLCDDRTELEAPVPTDAPFVSVERVWLPRYKSYLNVLRALVGSLPLQVAYYRSAEFAVRAEVLSEQHDLVMAHLIRTAPYAVAAGKPRVLEMTDAISRTYERARGAADRTRQRTWIYRIEEERVRAFEQATLEQFELVTVVSEQDREHLLRGRSAPNVAVFSNGVDTESFPFREPSSAEPVVAFVGNLTTLPNLDAANYFAREVLPLLRRKRPWTFRVIGRIARSDAQRLASIEGVEVTGQIPSVPDAVTDAQAGVCPMRIGSGIQNKILEYMALGLPTVTSSMSLQAIRAEPGREILVADEPAAYVAHLETLYADTALARTIAHAAHAYVTRQHGWETILRPLVERMLALVG
jgi:glycosyltransferase involved in cell wall biosynthesis